LYDSGTPKITFGHIPGPIDRDNYAEAGTIGLTAEISGNGKSISLAATTFYRRISNRLEFMLPPEIPLLQYKASEFLSDFGKSPKISCRIG
jgi:hypothetical protein